MRKRLIKQMVKNFYAQVRLVDSMGLKNKMSLREYLQGIKNLSPTMTQEEVEFGVSIGVGNERQTTSAI